MLEDFLGEEEFKNGITNSLNSFKFANVVPQDRWEELQQVQKDVNITRGLARWVTLW
jgi:aminopeptidase N